MEGLDGGGGGEENIEREGEGLRRTEKTEANDEA